jgi:hypothetical protein
MSGSSESCCSWRSWHLPASDAQLRKTRFPIIPTLLPVLTAHQRGDMPSPSCSDHSPIRLTLWGVSSVSRSGEMSAPSPDRHSNPAIGRVLAEATNAATPPAALPFVPGACASTASDKTPHLPASSRYGEPTGQLVVGTSARSGDHVSCTVSSLDRKLARPTS